MNAISINPLTLPLLPLSEHSLQAGRSAELSRLPNCSATYFAVQGKSVLYIAKIVNLAQRWAAYYRWEEVRITQKALKKISAKIATHCSMSDILAVRSICDSLFNCRAG
jgi:hypothetical protein